jgi:DNA-binding transcriptional MerR regulator
MSRRALPDKLFFRIGEVAALVGVKAHVLRYWEEELGVLVPMKTRGAHRQYRRRDVEIALHIKDMLQNEGLTLSGVKKRLREESRSAPKAQRPMLASIEAPRDGEVRLRAVLVELRSELVQLAAILQPGPMDEALEPAAEGAPERSAPEHDVTRDELEALVFAEVPSRRRER